MAINGSRKGLVVYLIPNLITSCSMFLGFFSIVRSIRGYFEIAAFAILFAGVFDALDGRVARMTGGDSPFGEQYDSLSDAVSFGVAPAVLMFIWSLNSFGRLGWLACFLFMVCGVLRLARFNVQKGSVERNFFQGLPIPIAAGTVASSLLLFQELGLESFRNYYMLLLTFVLAGLMVSNLRYRNFKNAGQDRRKSFLTLVGAIVALIIIAQNPKVNLFLLIFAYIVVGIVANIFKWKKYREAIEELKELELAEKREIEEEERSV